MQGLLHMRFSRAARRDALVSKEEKRPRLIYFTRQNLVKSSRAQCSPLAQAARRFSAGCVIHVIYVRVYGATGITSVHHIYGSADGGRRSRRRRFSLLSPDRHRDGGGLPRLCLSHRTRR